MELIRIRVIVLLLILANGFFETKFLLLSMQSLHHLLRPPFFQWWFIRGESPLQRHKFPGHS